MLLIVVLLVTEEKLIMYLLGIFGVLFQYKTTVLDGGNVNLA